MFCITWGFSYLFFRKSGKYLTSRSFDILGEYDSEYGAFTWVAFIFHMVTPSVLYTA